ncbi:MAG: SEC-C domain-containing protein [Candidatus Peribacteria bacterium]|nr:SEC-C domain-containing protein [Candidatus Peribacteria bacterium]
MKDFHYGLFILGTEKHESRRIDNQLRGRAGRQGDPGVSVFFVALDDTLMRKMGGERIKSMAGMLLSKADLESLELTQSQFTTAIMRSQKEIEAWHFSTRKHLFDYDSVIDKQRKNIYHTRDAIIEASVDEEKKAEWIARMEKQFLVDAQEVLNTQIQVAETAEQGIADLIEVLVKEFGLALTPQQREEYLKLTYQTLNEVLDFRLVEYFQSVFSSIDTPLLFNIFRDISLQVIDRLRVAHIDEMQYLKDKVGFMGYAQLDPLIVYKKESFEKFQDLLRNVKVDTTTFLMRLDFNAIVQQQAQFQIIEAAEKHPEILEKLKQASAQSPLMQQGNDQREMLFSDEDGIEVFEVDGEKADTPGEVILPEKRKVRPNDPCPCGSGKKYKKCCGKEA